MRRIYTFDTGEKSCHLGISNSYPNVLTAGSPGRIRRIADYLENPEMIESDRGLVTVHGSYKGIPVTAFSTGMGSASVSITLPEIIEACDSDEMRIIRLGTSGGLQKYLRIGDFVVTMEVERAESTSDKIMYDGYVARSSEFLTLMLEKTAYSCKADFQRIYAGTTRVTDDIYFDAIKSKNRGESQVIAVSMEASPIFALRDRYNRDDHRKIEAAELLVVSDLVVSDGEHIDRQEFERRSKEFERTHIISGLETLVNVQ